ncbi:uncharacterized protein LOC115758692 [Drosophila novamexicana]|uniref:uncharacterized protein LOC115758692 n=1 Tax=Drosophila novamexicana TaxID=47314 RepID=UPI0011E598EA|nr:uncharacterized protein LOC115758692 [Drosophila novamexicana]
MVLFDEQKKCDQPSSPGGSQGAQNPKKSCNLESYLVWSARLREFVCNEILQFRGIEERSGTVELWRGVAHSCLFVGNYHSATGTLESLRSPAIARLKITWNKLQVTSRQLDCMQRHAEGPSHFWPKQASGLNEQQTQSQKVDMQAQVSKTSEAYISLAARNFADDVTKTSSSCVTQVDLDETLTACASGIPHSSNMNETVNLMKEQPLVVNVSGSSNEISTTTTTDSGKPNDWVLIPVFADIMILALAERVNCLQRLPNGHININALNRMGDRRSLYKLHAFD